MEFCLVSRYERILSWMEKGEHNKESICFGTEKRFAKMERQR